MQWSCSISTHRLLCPVSAFAVRPACIASTGRRPLQRGSQTGHEASLESHFFGAVRQSLAVCPGLNLGVQRTQRRLQRGIQKVQAAFFGVGAPEAVLVAVVALIVFGPKGLAQAVKSLGATFRTISPSLKELVTASNDLRTSFEEQIGLDEIRNEFRTGTSYRPPPPSRSGEDDFALSRSSGSPSNGASSPAGSNGAAAEASSSSSDEPASSSDRGGSYFGSDFDVDIEAKRREAAQLAWGTATGSEAPVAKDSGSSSGNGGSAAADGGLAGLSLEALEAELARRKEARRADSQQGGKA